MRQGLIGEGRRELTQEPMKLGATKIHVSTPGLQEDTGAVEE